MKNEASYGIIPLKKFKEEWRVLLIQHNAGHWAFPKGHAEKGETHEDTAFRELLEETGLLVVKLLFDEPLTETYWFKHQEELIHKKVYYYLAQVKGRVVLQKEELSSYQWVPLEKADQYVTFAQAKSICQQAQTRLS